MIKDILSIPSCSFYLSAYICVELFSSLLPAISLWFSGQLLSIVQAAVDTRSIDTQLLIRIAAGRFLCQAATRISRHAKSRLAHPLNSRIKQYYSVHTFRAMARLDAPTFDDSAVQRQLEESLSPNSRSTIAWDAVTTVLHIATTLIQLTSQLSVLVSVLRHQRDGPLLALLSFAHLLYEWYSSISPFIKPGVWAATTKDQDYIKSEGLKRTVIDPAHRNEIVAGGMSDHLTHTYKAAMDAVADRAGDFFEAATIHRMYGRLSISSFLSDPLHQLPQLVFTLRAVQHPASIPLSLASLTLITQTTQSFTLTLFSFFDGTSSIANKLSSIRKLYEVGNIPNQVLDGTLPFPEDQSFLLQGLSIQFIDVSFKYPGSESYALRRVSFKIEKGQLCVIVGANGSGKSTILKLVARLYDPCEGTILIDGLDIRTLKLSDLRRAISVLFQDYTHFPLSIKDNIGIGNPAHASDLEKIRKAAQLGGAEDFIERLPDGFDTYLERPVKDHYSNLPGHTVDYSELRDVAGMSTGESKGLSGGQMQRIALSRTFMRSLVSEPNVGLLLFDEPSASLDPTAEHDLFERLRQLRGNKTMVFSSHRFGNLTRHADQILYMNDSVIVEEGTHDQLMKQNGEYARIWMLQARAFL
ncbi:uncharacterized protein LACBIDRAFT_301848 [Laccaria bicolor S238N-H82]|uniref:Predicted protein n=1 Tax=Laccaria bicolor (strain S238N-H82 / ATCC MYA-4686) TaxID=486041 RepID=B0CPJ3_LACBS|nr:uncharacterized protein LACBIDRAFT_301848 [Laccaria bicolor S238N-H82]EDR16100.1 predicted protein [Laccaria bicolor S238N-H82]|eukprot:XP_001874308.1 predicted protein [Laccaria bicolor S238N-H82]